MLKARMSGWNIAFLAMMAVGFAASIYHLLNERYGNAVIAAGAALLGSIVLLTDRATSEVRATPAPRSARAETTWSSMMSRESAPHERWLSAGILSGFAATIVMSLILIIGYVATGNLGDANGGEISRWFWALSHNDLTENVWDIPVVALSINLLAGLAWALVYAGLVEPRLKGPGWLRGMTFSLAPWLLSLLVFFPLAGAGLFGMSLDAGPLPAIGNLLAHLAYGVVLGTVFCLPEVSTGEQMADARSAQLENDGTAFGLVTGLTVGLIIGAVISAFATSDIKEGVNITLVAGAFGTAVGGVVGAFVGLDWGARHEATEGFSVYARCC